MVRVGRIWIQAAHAEGVVSDEHDDTARYTGIKSENIVSTKEQTEDGSTNGVTTSRFPARNGSSTHSSGTLRLSRGRPIYVQQGASVEAAEITELFALSRFEFALEVLWGRTHLFEGLSPL